MNTDFSLFRTKTTKTHLAGKFPFQIDFENRKNTFRTSFTSFPPNTDKTHSVLTLVETLGDPKSVMLGHFSRNTIKTPARLPQKFVKKQELMAFWAPKWSQTSPGRAAGPAWPAGLAWPPGGLPGLAWPAVCPAGSGRQQQRSRPPTPITAGGLFGWSGGARQPAHGMRISCVEPGPAGSFCPPYVTLAKGPKGLQNDQETCTAVVKRTKVKSYQVLLESRQAKC